MSLGLYIHVPFCAKKCRYCDFYSVSYRRDTVEKYVGAVCRNIRKYSDISRNVDTVYFGGGTPSLLSDAQIGEIISEIDKSFDLSTDAEITLEANPHTLSPDGLRKLRNIGVNRLSIGVQSLVDSELRFLGRTHTAKRAETAVLDAANVGFTNISCDLMIALPNQSAESLAYSIDRLAALPIQHISAYILKVEEGTSFDCDEIRRQLPDEEAVAGLYLRMAEMLSERGFAQYEVSNFAKPNYESRHNCRYWRCEDYIGIGPSAHSCYGGKRFAVQPDIQAFLDADVQQTYITDEMPCGFEEFAMLRLRLAEGLHLSDVEDHRKMIEKKIPDLEKAGYVKFDGETVSLTRKGFLMSNSVIEYLIF